MLYFLLHRGGEASPHNLLLLALLAEFVEVCSRFVREQESGKDSRFHIAKMAAHLRDLEAELDDLFEVERDGKPRLPRALSKSYVHGYVNIISKPGHVVPAGRRRESGVAQPWRREVVAGLGLRGARVDSEH